MSKKPKTLFLFYILVAYIILQFVWWSYLLTNLTTEVSQQKQAELKAKIGNEQLLKQETASVKSKQNKRVAMILGEGSVFLILLSLGIYRVKKSFEKETELAQQQKNFMLSVTHELKTPLAAIKLNLQTIAKRDLPKEKQTELISNCLKENDRLNQLLENVLLAARFENSEMKFYPEKIELAELINNLCSAVFIEAKIETTLQENIFVKTDRLALTSILSNLIENAIKYSSSGIKINLLAQNNKICIEVIDFGIGIKEQEKEKVFLKFYRAGNEETRKTKGTGLGLFIVKYLCENLNIEVELLKNKPQGCIFRLTFEEQN